jgi:hypothetical protein
MNDPKKEPPVKQRELPRSPSEAVQKQPANDRAIEGEGTRGDKVQGVVRTRSGTTCGQKASLAKQIVRANSADTPFASGRAEPQRSGKWVTEGRMEPSS